jgi:predicted transcriptional regulator
MKTLSLKLPDAVAIRLATVARKRSQSKSAVVRAILDENLTEDDSAAAGSCLELAADLVGCVAGAHDLSTHQKHMQGYGQ